MLATAAAIHDPFEQSFFVLTQLPYLQPFDDVNKRVSRLAANIPFIKSNLSPLSFTDVSLTREDVNSEELLKVRTRFLYENWQPSQKDQRNLSEEKVKFYYDKIANKEKIRPIILQDIIKNKENTYIRTLDGRHRLYAVYKFGLDEIAVIVSDQLKKKLEEAFPDLFIKHIIKKEF